MLSTTIGQLLINSRLPVELRDYNRVLDKKGISSLFQQLAEKHPDKYREIAKQLSDISREFAYYSGGFSFGLRHFIPPQSVTKLKAQQQAELDKVLSDRRTSDTEKEENVIRIAGKYSKLIEKAGYEDSLKEGNPLAYQVLSGSRGNTLNLKSLIAGDGLYQDASNNIIPIPITRSYSEGLSPAEYWAGSYGARQGVISTKKSTQDAGYFGKQLVQASHRLIVTAQDADDPKTLYNRGLPTTTDDPDNEGSLLARQYGPYKRDSVITPKVLAHLRELGHHDILVRSPIVSDSPEGGVYAKDVGVREKGRIAPLSDNIGIAAAQGLCLAKGTLVRMANGLVKPIEEIVVGDMVLGADISGQTFPSNVVNVFNNGLKKCVQATFHHDDSNTEIIIDATPAHKILALQFGSDVKTAIIPLYLVIDGINDVLCVDDEQRGYRRYVTKCISIGIKQVFDIQVDHPDHLFVLANGLVVSNSEPLSQSQLCLTKGTVVRMADWSTKEIEDIVAGDIVLGADISGQTFPSKVINTFNNGLKECYQTRFKIKLSQQYVTLESTLDHKLLALQRQQAPFTKGRNIIDKFTVADIKKVYQRTAALMPAEFDDKHLLKKTDDFAFFVGLTLGDGCYTESVRGCYLSCFDSTLIDNIKDYLLSLNLKATLCAGQIGYYRVSQVIQTETPQDKEGRFTGSYRNPAMQYLKKYNMLFKYAHEKVIPDKLLKCSNHVIAKLLAGLFATDGSVFVNKQQKKRSRPYISFGSTSEILIRQVADLLWWRFGIYCGTINCNTKNRKHPLYSFNITSTIGINRFYKYIQPIPGVKGPLLNELIKNRIIERDYNHEKYYIREIIPLGLKPTYDIEVKHKDHLFVLANGLIVSNSAKHGGGIAGATKGVSGFAYINQLVQVPKHFKGGAAHSQTDGKVEQIVPAPAGGNYVFIGGQRHYVGAGYDISVKPGDTVEAGDVISDGAPNPAEIVKHKGIGEGRRYFLTAFRKAYKDADINTNRRNVEVLTRGLINHVRLTDEFGPHVPDDVVPYSYVAHNYSPRIGFEATTPAKAKNMYLESPILHYTIGTKIRPSVISELNKHNIDHIIAHPEPPPFEPEMVRGMQNLSHDPDWMTRMLGANLERNMLNSVHRGSTSNELGTSYVPGLARAIDFGRKGFVRDWHEADSKFKTKVIP